MDDADKWNQYVLRARIVGIFQFVISCFLLSLILQEMIFGFLQITNFEPLQWLFMFVTTSFSLLWSLFTGMGLFFEAHSWRLMNFQHKYMSTNNQVITPIQKPEERTVCLYSFVTWGFSMVVFILTIMIGNLILYINGPCYDPLMCFTWIFPTFLFALVIHAFPGRSE